MEVSEGIKRKVLSHANEERLIALCSKLIQIPSPVEEEGAEKENQLDEWLQLVADNWASLLETSGKD